jgi:hypothetical protein
VGIIVLGVVVFGHCHHFLAHHRVGPSFGDRTRFYILRVLFLNHRTK